MLGLRVMSSLSHQTDTCPPARGGPFLPPPSAPHTQYWEVRSNEVDIAVTPSSNKAFIHWHVRGLEKASQQV